MLMKLTPLKEHATHKGHVSCHSPSKGCSGFGIALLDLLERFASVVGPHVWQPDLFPPTTLLLPDAALCLVGACE